MNLQRKLWLGLMASGIITVTAWGQGAAPIPAAPAAPAPANLWSFLLPSAEQKTACKLAFCNSAIGKLINGAAGPMSAMSGGLMGGRCQKSSVADDIKKKGADDPDGLAARVKADEEEAKVRRANVRFLGTVDCNYWPEAIGVLKTALRKDRNECVRFEAALALRNGCCCNNEIIDALKNCILGENKKDPNPPEKSARVRAAAAEALARCPMLQAKQTEKLLTKGPPPITDPAEYYKKIAALPKEEVAASARAVLASLKQGVKPAGGVQPGAGGEAVPFIEPIPQRATSVVAILVNAFGPSPHGGPRSPFFSHLTRNLMGTQEYMTPGISHPMFPHSREIIVPADNEPKPPTKLPAPRPLSISSTSTPPSSNVMVEQPMPAPAPAPRLSVVTNQGPPMAIRLVGPSQVLLGEQAVFEVRVTNQSSRPITRLTLFGWLPDGLSHFTGQEIKGEVTATIAPGEVKMLRLPTSAVRLGHGKVRIKIATDTGEALANANIEVTTPASQASQARPSLSFKAAKNPPVQSPAPLPRVEKASAPLQIIQSAPAPSRGTVGVVTMEEEPASFPRPASLGTVEPMPSRR
ncbi:MAG: hypothetical protein HYX68_01615 [Planctomycetes bacterium]|nr:hypothetical protein [Planctomycetota bacterium]